MLEKRQLTSGVVLNYPEKTLWITGGLSKRNAGKGHSSSEFIYLNKPAEKGPNLPFEIHRHCGCGRKKQKYFLAMYYLG